jgi:anaerobic selenocysteine-containing dehydrogenase
MELTRRQLLKLTGLGLGGVLFASCTYDLREGKVESPNKIPEDLVSGIDTWYATLSRDAGMVEGVIVRVMEGRAKKVEGNPNYPTNQGKHSARSEAGLQALYHPDRIAGPQRRLGDRGVAYFEPMSWAGGMELLLKNLNAASANPGSVVLITDPLRGSMARLVMRFVSSLGARHLALTPVGEQVLQRAIKDVYGQNRLPHFDIANANYVLSFGADFLGTWLNPVGYGKQYGHFRQGEGRERGTLVCVDPRFSLTAANADMWVPVKPGTEGVLALSIAYALMRDGKANAAAASALTGGRGAAALEAYKPEEAAKTTGVPAEKIEKIAKGFADHRPALALGGGSAGAHSNGLFNLTAIYTLNMLAGNTNQTGGVIFNPPPPVPELAPWVQEATLADWQQLVRDMNGGKVKVLIVRGADPVYGLPKFLGFTEALAKVETVFTFSSFEDDTSAYADYVLPEHTDLESWGDDVPIPGPGFQTVGIQQPVVREYLEARRIASDAGSRSFGDVLLAVAEAFPNVQAALPWKTYREMVMDAAQKLHALGRGNVTAPAFSRFWIDLLAQGGWWDQNAKESGTAPAPKQLPAQAPAPQFQGGASEFHLLPFPSRTLLDGRGAHLPWLQAAPDPITTVVWQTWVEMNSGVAREMGINEGEIVRLVSPVGSIEAPVYPHPAVQRDVLAVPIGNGHRKHTRYGEGRGANVFDVLAPAAESSTGALAWAATKVRVEKTGRRIHLSKFEGNVGIPVQLEEPKIIEVTPR